MKKFFQFNNSCDENEYYNKLALDESVPDYEFLMNQLEISKWSKFRNFDYNFLNKTITIIGLGGSGCHVAFALIHMGFKKVIIIDKDFIEKKNLTRQILYSKQDVGEKKANCAKSFLQKNSIRSEIISYDIDIVLEPDLLDKIIKSSDFVFSLVDNSPAIYITSKACFYNKKPTLYFGTCILSGLSSIINFQREKAQPCLWCMCWWGRNEAIKWSKNNNDNWYDVIVSKPEKLFNEKMNKGVNPSWYLTPSTAGNIAIILMIRHLLGEIIENYFNVSLYKLTVDKEYFKPLSKCEICHNF
jgi:molybdopterin/thiamine biosynthesis adenylyltransferase